MYAPSLPLNFAPTTRFVSDARLAFIDKIPVVAFMVATPLID